MKPKVGRKKRSGVPVRVLLRIPEGLQEIHERYNDQDRSEIYSKALASIFPKANTDRSSTPVLMRPSKTVTAAICRVVISGQWVRLFLPEKNEDFRQLVKRFLYTWDGCWERNFPTSVDVLDRAAEISNQILLAGFWIQVENDSLKDRIVSGAFTPEAFKTVKRCLSGAYKDWFVINWPKGVDCYDAAMRITAAKYSDGSVYVPPEFWAEVEDFADLKGFVLSDGAIKLASETKLAQEQAIIVTPKRKTKKKATQNGGTTEGIHAHLRDDAED